MYTVNGCIKYVIYIYTLGLRTKCLSKLRLKWIQLKHCNPLYLTMYYHSSNKVQFETRII